MFQLPTIKSNNFFIENKEDIINKLKKSQTDISMFQVEGTDYTALNSLIRNIASIEKNIETELNYFFRKNEDLEAILKEIDLLKSLLKNKRLCFKKDQEVLKEKKIQEYKDHISYKVLLFKNTSVFCNYRLINWDAYILFINKKIDESVYNVNFNDFEKVFAKLKEDILKELEGKELFLHKVANTFLEKPIVFKICLIKESIEVNYVEYGIHNMHDAINDTIAFCELVLSQLKEEVK